MKPFFALLLILLPTVAAGAAEPTVLFEERFDRPDITPPHETVGPAATYDADSKAIRFHCTKPGEDYLIFPLDAKGYRGKRVQLEAVVRGSELSQSATPYFNSKLQLSFDTKTQIQNHPEAPRKTGTYDWWKARVVCYIPDDASNLKLAIGLQDVTGTYWVKDLRVIELPIYPGQPYAPSTAPLQKTPSYRGVDSSRKTEWTEQDFKDLKQWNVNLFRYQMLPFDQPVKTREQFLAWIDREIPKLDRFLALADKYGIKVVLDLQVGPGMYDPQLGSNVMSWAKADQDTLVEVWKRMAKHFRSNRSIYAYDPLNEPREENYTYDENGGVEWQQLIERIVSEIRSIDPDTPILVEASDWSSPEGFVTLKPVNGKNLIYSPHFYLPHAYTHQQVLKSDGATFSYPGMIMGLKWERQEMLKSLEPVIAFQKKYNVPIYIGEFGVARWAPGSQQWLGDAISIFEEHGWDWSYHAFREWDGWSAEHGEDRSDHTVHQTTQRKEILLKYFARNAATTRP